MSEAWDLNAATIVRVQKGDVLVVSTEAPLEYERVEELQEAFKRILPEGVEVVVLANGSTLTVVSGDITVAS